MGTECLLERATERLSARGQRITPARLRVIRVLTLAEFPLSPHELLGRLRGQGQPYDRMTLYRTLNLLETHGVIHHLAFGGGYLPCRLREAGCHHFLTCRGCGEVREVHCPGMVGVERTVAAATGFRIERHEVQFAGLCPACA